VSLLSRPYVLRSLSPSAGRSILAKAAGYGPWLLLAAVALAAIALRLHNLENADTSWLLTLTEKLLDGRHDFVEVNPPGAIFAYVPAVWLARISGIQPEAACDVLVFLVAAVSLGLASLILGPRFFEQRNVPVVAAGVAAVLLVLPTYTFGEREHLCVILILPWVAALAVRFAGSTPDLRLLAGAGLACGLCIMIKPHFIMNVGVLSFILAWRLRSWRMLFTLENCAAALVLLLYGAILWTQFPDFLARTAPMVAAVYVPDRLDLPTLVFASVSILWACVMWLTVMTGAFRQGDTVPIVLLAMSCVSYFSFLLQGKGWPYHSYPAIAFAFLALAIRLGTGDAAMSTRAKGVRVLNLLCALAMFYVGFIWFNVKIPRDTWAIVRTIDKIAPQPTIAMIGGDMSVGFPITRLVHGTWAQRSVSLWMAGSALRRKSLPDTDLQVAAAMDQYETLDRSMVRDDIRLNRPDILLVEAKASAHFDWLKWARTDPLFASTLDAYEFVEQVDDVQIWRRR
jgi:hypothetical protein